MGRAHRSPRISGTLVFDLDPDESVAFTDVRTAALKSGDTEVLGLQSFALLTGGKGVHVVVPLGAGANGRISRLSAVDWQPVAGRGADRYIASATKARRRGKIFIDWLRNERGATAVAPYSLRARQARPLRLLVVGRN